MNALRRFLRALHEERVRAHKLWLLKRRVLMPKPPRDERLWSGRFMESLKQ